MTEIHAPEGEFNAAVLAASLIGEHVADTVEILNKLEPSQAADVVRLLPRDVAIEILDKPELDFGAEIIETLPRYVAAPLLAGMSADMAADIVQLLEEPAKTELLGALDDVSRAAIVGLLAYPENTAGAMMTTEFVSVPSNWTVDQTLQHIRRVERSAKRFMRSMCWTRHPPPCRRGHLRRLIAGEPSANILTLIPDHDTITTLPLVDREDVARLITRHDLLAVPVLDKAGHVLGIVTVDDIIDAIIEESTEDVQKFGGMSATEEPYMQIGLFEMIRKRGGWLSILFVSEMLTASVMQHFEGQLEKALVLTLFIPLIMSSGGNSGSQATSLLIRSLALHDVKLADWWRVMMRELPTGLILGGLLGLIGFGRVVVWQKFGIYDYGEHWVLVGLTVAAALVGVVTFGSVAGSMLPFALQRVGFDPASASAPFVATLVDVTGLMIYFSAAVLILRGTLL
jgi:magnesium transporter